MQGFRSILAAACLGLLAACSRAPDASTAGAPAPRSPTTEASSAAPVRIVSLSPAMTRCVVDLGAQAAVVGRTPWCAAPDAAVVGSLQEWDLEAIESLHPTMLLVQGHTADPALARTAQRAGATLVTLHLDRLKDIEDMVVALAERLTAAGVPAAAAAGAGILTDAANRRTEARAAGGPARLGPTLLLFSVDPPTAFGTGTYVADLWEALGGQNAISQPGYPELSLEDIVRLDPSHIVVVRSTPPTGASSPLSTLPPALRQRLQVLVAPALLEPSTACLREGTSAIAALRPDAASSPSPAAQPRSTP